MDKDTILFEQLQLKARERVNQVDSGPVDHK